MGDHLGAILDYTKVIDLKPDDARAYQSRGTSFIRLKKYWDAIDNFDLAIFLYPEYAMAHYNRAVAKLYLEMIEEACLDLQKAAQLGLNAAETLLEKKCTSNP
jgi:tetratricopeptide (TPR) repeat protein